MKYQILNGDNRHVLKTLPDNSIDSIITDPPYGIDFLGKSWDANTGSLETYRECLRVLKPGGHLLAFSAARTYHHLAITLEQAGFEIRDQIMWIYSSGFPKSQDVGKSIERSEKKTKGRLGPLYTPAQGNPKITACEVCGAGNGVLKANKCSNDPCPFKEIAKPADNEWAGWGTALKPAHEPICMARKPSKLSTAKNVQKWGVGALNIDATRIPIEGEDTRSGGSNGVSRLTFGEGETSNEDSFIGYTPSEQGRFPSNVIGEIAEEYQKYFYCPKVSRKERHLGHEMPPAMFGDMKGCYDENGERYAVGFDNRGIATEASMLADMGGYFIDEQGKETKINGKNIWLPQTGNIYIHGLKEEYRKWCEANGKTPNVGNNHPTVKPVELMKYLIKLVTPPNGRVLDPFNGSGSTGMAAVELGYTYTGIELDPNYCEISRRRIAAHFKRADPLRASGLFD